ncbi:hypothetical protein CDL12_10069 [Handroanthus impetiginosus]|uniref:Uncharacterized protein n=1 Tax=Handroanthus impetiginosus TaxID=429701 RepID=A0A2G9HIA4_9LAMI|nr:hypothetical protein CDL12_10069 [Handroanthus impetiginosus]
METEDQGTAEKSTKMEAEGESTAAAAVVSEAAQEDDSEFCSWIILSKLLDLFETVPPPMKVRFIKDPYSSPVIFQSSSAYVTINGNEESCGSSFSDSDSSVMASIDLGGAGSSGGARWFDCDEAREWLMEDNAGDADVDVEFGGFSVNSCDYRDEDDDEDTMWVEFLGGVVG